MHSSSIGIIGAGAAGLITAKTLLDDGFENITILTRDQHPGGTWAVERIYPSLKINNVHGEYRFSSLPMPPPSKAESGRLTGEDLSNYLESFTTRFLAGKIRYGTEVLDVRHNQTRDTSAWKIRVRDLVKSTEEDIFFDKTVLCSGGSSAPLIPPAVKASMHKFDGPVLHTYEFKKMMEIVLKTVGPRATPDAGTVVVVGGGKSAQDAAAMLAREGRKVTVVFGKANAFIAAPIPLPEFIRKSRILAIMSGYIELNSCLERFLHKTGIGSWIVFLFWEFLVQISFLTARIPLGSPLRNTHSLFWEYRSDDLGAPSSTDWLSLANNSPSSGIKIISPAKVIGLESQAVLLSDGSKVNADAVVLGTGFSSSWDALFDDETKEELGLTQHAPSDEFDTEWDSYQSLSRPPRVLDADKRWATSIYRGIVPSKIIDRRDFAINGSILAANFGYLTEVSSHWISSYFLDDPFLKVPSAEDAFKETQRHTAWLRKRFPYEVMWANASYSGDLALWSWPQTVDKLLRDMSLRDFRSGGSALTWAFRIIDLKEISTLGAERRALRGQR
ncbi:FAD/NAD-P-binding domain-containing protein [Stereum hirsutum FP-91666 SS1]|uniref:FAD/NAD-P-binding domain-containing protein n=1 Tax=Stereum hirsutum (strain FP-91666) TaxID=721885 RepID=UPI000444A543|nr:FAD/NAD-P-binding domain-containing protein [Stereum hirsutum FP-91666 SS1]EIM86307.1 FAD/NAD-P-binding domain-containing protein [Stereum hirsutum FP-91666 SS1]